MLYGVDPTPGSDNLCLILAYRQQLCMLSKTTSLLCRGLDFYYNKGPTMRFILISFFIGKA